MPIHFYKHHFVIESSCAIAQVPKELMQSVDGSYTPADVIVISGPTAVGKTDLSLQLCELLGAEVISADSMQVYCGMDIGTAKPTLEQRQRAQHHMIDVREIDDPMNVAQFCEEALQAIRSVIARGRIPIIVGGSGFYVDALLRGPPAGPPADPFVRAYLDAEMERLGPEALYEQIEKLDPEYARSITRADRHKIMRSLEIMILTQGKVSDIPRHKLRPEFRFHAYFLHRSRPLLYERINSRCHQMIDDGLLEEVRFLSGSGLLENPSAASAIGYRQSLEFLKSNQTVEDRKQYLEAFCQASRHYAKRQFTWFRKDPLFLWLDLDLFDEELIIQRIALDCHRR